MGDADLQTLIAEREQGFEQLQDRVESGDVPSENRPSTLSFLSKDARWLGDLYALDGQPDASTAWFDEAARYGLDHLRAKADRTGEHAWESRPQQTIDLLYAAVLGRDEDRLADVVTATRASPAPFPEQFPDAAPWYHYSRSLAGCLADEPETASEHRAQLAAASERHTAGFDEFFDALGGVLDGLLADDGRQLAAGIEALIADLSDSERDPHHVRVPASALVELGSRRGLAVDVADGHVYEHVRG